MPEVCVFSPSPILTVTVEGNDDEPDQIHLHAGGQGVWVARMIRQVDIPVRLVGCFGGETGLVSRLLVESEGIDVSCVELGGESSAYVHDRRGGEREEIATMPFLHLDRHALDELYSTTIAAALEAGVCVLAGVPDPDALPAETYQRLASDLRTNGATVIADLHGSQLRSALEGGISSLKVSHEELESDGLLEPDADLAGLIAAGEQLHKMGADEVVISRADQPAVASVDGEWCEVRGPEMQVVDHRGAGDSMTALLAAGAALGLDRHHTIRLAAGAGGLNVTRHGLATGHLDAIRQLAERVEIVRVAV